MAPTLTLPPHTATWPRPVQVAVARRAEALADQIVGDVWDLAELDGGSGRWPSGPVDTIVSIAELPRYADLSLVADGMREHLRPDGRLVLVEPAATAGLWATIRASLAARQLAADLHLDRDVPWDLHRCGWRFFRVERDQIPGVPWGLRFLASGVAGPMGGTVPRLVDPIGAVTDERTTT